MKKIIASCALGVLLVTGILVSTDSQHDTTMEREPGVLSISNHSSSF